MTYMSKREQCITTKITKRNSVWSCKYTALSTKLYLFSRWPLVTCNTFSVKTFTNTAKISMGRENIHYEKRKLEFMLSLCKHDYFLLLWIPSYQENMLRIVDNYIFTVICQGHRRWSILMQSRAIALSVNFKEGRALYQREIILKFMMYCDEKKARCSYFRMWPIRPEGLKT